MKNRKPLMQSSKAIISLLLILLLLASCTVWILHVQENRHFEAAKNTLTENVTIISSRLQLVMDNAFTGLEEQRAAWEASLSPLEKTLLSLQRGEIENLVGFPFGTPIDYSLYEPAYSDTSTPHYRLKSSEERYFWYLFSEDEGYFCGFSARGFPFDTVYTYFDIRMYETSLQDVIDFLGEPQENWSEKFNKSIYDYSEWTFDKAVLTLQSEDGLLSYIEYEALPETLAAIAAKRESDLARDMREIGGDVEDIYAWDASLQTDRIKDYEFYIDPCCEGYDADLLPGLADAYLAEHGVQGEGSVLRFDDDSYIEYYMDKEKGQYTFIFHLFDCYNTTVSPAPVEEGIFCTTYHVDEKDRTGTLLRCYEEESGVTTERLYDADGRKLAEITYEYIDSFPFLLVTDGWNLDTSYAMVGSCLCRNQKNWFYKEQAHFDEEGKIINYDISDEGPDYANNGKEYFTDSLTFFYDENNCLTDIHQALRSWEIEADENDEGDYNLVRARDLGYSGYMEFQYDDNGTLQNVQYARFNAETSDASGSYAYDALGRMTCAHYYMSHGSHKIMMLYEDDSQMPWARFAYCRGEKDFGGSYLILPR